MEKERKVNNEWARKIDHEEFNKTPKFLDMVYFNLSNFLNIQ